MVLMDGAKELYMSIIKMLKPHIRQGAIVLADNVSTFFMKKALASYVEFMQDPINIRDVAVSGWIRIFSSFVVDT